MNLLLMLIATESCSELWIKRLNDRGVAAAAFSWVPGILKLKGV